MNADELCAGLPHNSRQEKNSKNNFVTAPGKDACQGRDASAEGTGRKGTFELNKTLGSQLNRTHLRIWNVQIFDLVPPSGQKIDFKNMDFSIIFYFFDLLRTFFGCK